jgi:hypothetical protein
LRSPLRMTSFIRWPTNAPASPFHRSRFFQASSAAAKRAFGTGNTSRTALFTTKLPATALAIARSRAKLPGDVHIQPPSDFLKLELRSVELERAVMRIATCPDARASSDLLLGGRISDDAGPGSPGSRRG